MDAVAGFSLAASTTLRHTVRIARRRIRCDIFASQFLQDDLFQLALRTAVCMAFLSEIRLPVCGYFLFMIASRIAGRA